MFDSWHGFYAGTHAGRVDPSLDRARLSWALPATVSIVSPHVCPSIMATITRTVRSISFLHQTPASFSSFGLPRKSPRTRWNWRRSSTNIAASDGFVCFKVSWYMLRLNKKWIKFKPIACRDVSIAANDVLESFKSLVIHVAFKRQLNEVQTYCLLRCQQVIDWSFSAFHDTCCTQTSKPETHRL